MRGATTVGTARKPIVPVAFSIASTALLSASATSVGTARKPGHVVDVPQSFVRRSSRLGRAAEMSAKIATNAKIPLRVSRVLLSA